MTHETILKTGEIFLPYSKPGSDLRDSYKYDEFGILNIFQTFRNHQRQLLYSVGKLDEILFVISKYPQSKIELDADTHWIWIHGEEDVMNELIVKELIIKIPYEECEFSEVKKENKQEKVKETRLELTEEIPDKTNKQNKEKSSSMSIELFLPEKMEKNIEEIDMEDYNEQDLIKMGNIHLGYCKKGEDMFHYIRKNDRDVEKSIQGFQRMLMGVVEHMEEILEVLEKFPDARINIDAEGHFIDIYGDKDIMNELFERELVHEERRYLEESYPDIYIEELEGEK